MGLVTEATPSAQRVREMGADVTYTTANDLAFTYLRDCTAASPGQLVSGRSVGEEGRG